MNVKKLFLLMCFCAPAAVFSIEPETGEEHTMKIKASYLESTLSEVQKIIEELGNIEKKSQSQIIEKPDVENMEEKYKDLSLASDKIKKFMAIIEKHKDYQILKISDQELYHMNNIAKELFSEFERLLDFSTDANKRAQYLCSYKGTHKRAETIGGFADPKDSDAYQWWPKVRYGNRSIPSASDFLKGLDDNSQNLFLTELMYDGYSRREIRREAILKSVEELSKYVAGMAQSKQSAQ